MAQILDLEKYKEKKQTEKFLDKLYFIAYVIVETKPKNREELIDTCIENNLDNLFINRQECKAFIESNIAEGNILTYTSILSGYYDAITPMQQP